MRTLSRSSRKKRQTRLAFSPVPSSSPAAEDWNDGFSTPSKRRRLESRSEGPSLGSAGADEQHIRLGTTSVPAVVVDAPSRLSELISDPSGMLPSPVKSSGVELADSHRDVSTDSDTASDMGPGKHVISNVFNRRSHIGSSPRQPANPSTPISIDQSSNGNVSARNEKSKLRARLKQSKIDLSLLPAGASSPVEPQLGRSYEVGVSSPIDLDSSSDASCEDVIVFSTAARRHARKAIAVTSDDSDSEKHNPTNPPSNSKKVTMSANNANKSPDEPNTPQISLTKQKSVSTRGMSSTGPEESKLTEKRQTRSMARATSTLASDSALVDETEGDSEAEKRPTRSMARATSTLAPDSVLVDEIEEVSEAAVKTPSKRRLVRPTTRERKSDTSHDGSEDSEEEVLPSPIKRRARVRHGTANNSVDRAKVLLSPLKSSSQQEKEDLDEDLEDLRDSSAQKSRTRNRVVSSERNEKRRQLEVLRRRRAGEKINDVASDSDPAVPPRRALYDSEVSEDAFSVIDEEEDSDGVGAVGIESVRQSLRADADDYDEDFVVDDDQTLGAPTDLEEVPLEFTRHAHKRPIEHFKDAVEWMVQKKLNPAFNRNDPVYRTAFFRLDDEVQGYSSSRFMSTAWGPNFSKALKARPVFYETAVPTMFDHKCDACNRSGHPAKYRITFGGKAYHHDSLEDISDNEEDEEAEDDEQSHDSKGNLIPGVDVEYFVGRFCKANAETAHALSHWRYHLNQWVLDWLQNEGYSTAERIVQREKWSIRKKRDYANEVVDTMEQKGEIRALYRDFKHNLEAAREVKPSRYHAG